jgi:hypothetical protein
MRICYRKYNNHAKEVIHSFEVQCVYENKLKLYNFIYSFKKYTLHEE